MISCCPLPAAQPGDPTHWASCPHILSITNRHPLAPAWPPPPGGGELCITDSECPSWTNPERAPGLT